MTRSSADELTPEPREPTETALRNLHAVTTQPRTELPEQIVEVLKLGCRQFGLPFGAASQALGDRIRVEFVQCPQDELQRGSVMQLCNTFCREVLESRATLAIQDAEQSEWRDHPAHRVTGLESYLGTPVEVDGGPWGTLCFFDFAARREPFTQGERELVELFAQRVQLDVQNVTAQQRLRAVLEGTGPTVGEAFFSSMVEHLGKTLGVRLTFVAECIDERRARTLAVWDRGRHRDNFEYEVTHTPCDRLDTGDVVHYPSGLARHFPNDPAIPERGYESYVGAPILDSAGRRVGHLVALHDHRLELGTQDRWLFEIFATRAGAEIERARESTHRLQVERQLMHAEKLKSLGVLAGNVAHDFNNLLTGILGNADLARCDLAPGSRPYTRIQQVELAARRSEGLTRQLLAYADRSAFESETVDVNGVVGEMSDLLETAVSNRAALIREFADGLPSVQADPNQLRQVVMNLIMNASDALEGFFGRVTLRTGKLSLSADDIAEYTATDSLEPGSYVFVEVEDTGVGMDGQTRRRMFDPFFSTKSSGSGLGLSAVLGIVQRHEGGIQISSQPNVGTRIRVVLPIGEPEPTERSEPDRRSEAEALTPRSAGVALIVDDEELVLDVIRAALEEQEISVLTVADGARALELFRERSDDVAVVVIDLSMPGMDGVSTVREMKEHSPKTPVLLMSGFDEETATRRFRDVSLAGFVQKPFGIEEFVDKVSATLAG